MPKSLTKVVYKPDSQSTDEYTVIVDPVEYKKWKDGDTSIPLAQVVDSFTVLFSTQGAQGLLGQPSKQQLDNDFGTHKEDDVILKILKEGREQKTNALSENQGPTSLNIMRGGMQADLS